MILRFSLNTQTDLSGKGEKMTGLDLKEFEREIGILRNELLEIRGLVDNLQHAHSIGETFRGALEVVEKTLQHENNVIELIYKTLSASMVYLKESIDSVKQDSSETSKELTMKILELEKRVRLLEDQKRASNQSDSERMI
jgi:hypothetical protein